MVCKSQRSTKILLPQPRHPLSHRNTQKGKITLNGTRSQTLAVCIGPATIEDGCGRLLSPASASTAAAMCWYDGGRHFYSHRKGKYFLHHRRRSLDCRNRRPAVAHVQARAPLVAYGGRGPRVVFSFSAARLRTNQTHSAKRTTPTTGEPTPAINGGSIRRLVQSLSSRFKSPLISLRRILLHPNCE